MTDGPQPGTCSLRAAEQADAREVAGLVSAAYSHYIERIGSRPGPMTENYAEVIRRRHVTVAERGGTIAGVIVLAVAEEGFLIENVAVHPAHQRTGLGKRLLDLAEAEARRRGFDSIYLYTHHTMTESQALYSRLGYREYEPHYRRGAARVYMRKPLAPQAH